MHFIVQAARNKDQAATPRLIRSLRSDDPLVRLAAGDALVRITGVDQGYTYFGSYAEREAAIQRWEKWLAAAQVMSNTSDAQPAAATPQVR